MLYLTAVHDLFYGKFKDIHTPMASAYVFPVLLYGAETQNSRRSSMHASSGA